MNELPIELTVIRIDNASLIQYDNVRCVYTAANMSSQRPSHVKRIILRLDAIVIILRVHFNHPSTRISHIT